jgi:type III pantothenate kinase
VGAKIVTYFNLQRRNSIFFINSSLIFVVMKDNQHVLVFDLGNTRIKSACFFNDELIEVEYFNPDEVSSLISYCNQFKDVKKIVASVRSDAYNQNFQLALNGCQFIDTATPNGLISNYQSPTLGIDRLCNAVALKNTKGGTRVSIDIGTCVKFDCIDENGVYLGGSISPGINLRYRALNDYTAKLPLLNEKSPQMLIGNTTPKSISSGVMNGVLAEILGFMDFYRANFTDLTFFVTGGDAENFDFPLKSDIFVDKNLTLKGVYLIYKFNAV